MLIMKKIHLYIAFLLSACLMAACQDDDSFSTSASHFLTFSTDTVKMDTVFSAVPTTTKSLWVYNRSGDGLRCTSVRLENGAASGFRVNVDGVYLSANSNYAVDDIEVRNKDSIRVFVELTSPENGALTPQYCEDNLIFTLESGVEQRVNLNAYTWDATKLTDVRITRDSTLSSSGKPIIIYGGITVDSAATLTLAPGTTLYFHNDAGINVYGRLRSLGTMGNEVVLRGDRIDHMFDYLPYDNVPGQWQGIHLYGSSYGNELTFTDLHSTYHGLVADSSDVERTKLTMMNSTIHNCQGYGLRSVNSKMVIGNSQFTNTLADCVNIDGGDVTMNNCTMAQFYPFDAARQAAIWFLSVNHPLLNLQVRNSLITGYADDVMIGSPGDSTIAFNYLFDHCMIRTPKIETKDSVYFTNVVFEDVKDTTQYGEKHFKKIDTENLRYDFDLDSLSAAIDKADKTTALPTDRKGRERDSLPDIGAYEWIRPTSEK